MKKLSLSFEPKQIILPILIFLTLIVSLFFYLFSYRGSHRTFFFERIDSKGTYIEKRFVPKSPHSDKITGFIEELLLGPQTPRLKPVFSRGTKLISCFTRKKTLYVNFSRDLLKSDGEVSDFTVAEQIFKENIFKNFRNIDIIEIYIDGIHSYENANLFNIKK
jgi:hypothetical protein